MTVTPDGYVLVQHNGDWVREHRLVAEIALGKPLPFGAVVHHVDGDKANNANANLVICEDASYHQLLHIRQRAMELCGDPNKRKCARCGEYDDPAQMVERAPGAWIHPEDGPEWEVPRPATKRRLMLDKRGYLMRFGKWCRNPAARAKRRTRSIFHTVEVAPE